MDFETDTLEKAYAQKLKMDSLAKAQQAVTARGQSEPDKKVMELKRLLLMFK